MGSHGYVLRPTSGAVTSTSVRSGWFGAGLTCQPAKPTGYACNTTDVDHAVFASVVADGETVETVSMTVALSQEEENASGVAAQPPRAGVAAPATSAHPCPHVVELLPA